MSGAAAQASPGRDERPTAPGAPSLFVPADPVWALVRRRQAAWGYTDDEMAAWVGLGRHVDHRGWMLRSTARHILRRLNDPRPAMVGTAALARQLNIEQRAATAAHERATERMATLRRLYAVGASLDRLAAELRVTTTAAQTIAAEAGLSFDLDGQQ